MKNIDKGELKKLTLTGYSKKGGAEDDKVGAFTATCNPASISMSYPVSNYTKPGDSVETDAEAEPPSMNFELILDATISSVDGNPPKDIPTLIKELKAACYDVDGKTHTLNYVRINWGNMTNPDVKGIQYESLIKSLSITYTLFAPSGIPLRAKVSLSFGSSMESGDKKSSEGKSSPDLTHKVTIKSGDNLPNLCNKIYGDPKYFHQIARFNKIANFRSLKPGVIVSFPPIKTN